MTVLLCVSASAEEAQRLQLEGPRRDFVELAKAIGAETIFRSGTPGQGLLGRVAGPHVRQAWQAAAQARNGDAIFADGEHNGLPLALFLSLRRRRVRLTMLGHFIDKRWKRLLFRLLSRTTQPATVIVHSLVQREVLRRCLGGRWQIVLTAYQVDTDYWRTEATPPADALPLVLAVGSENRDYETLVEAVRDLPVRVLIAAGSHWARNVAHARALPPNVDYTKVPLSFSELRAAYEASALVAVPLHEVSNQSGVTTILEALSMARPVVTTATTGQRECVEGELILKSGSPAMSTSDRGPACVGGTPSIGATGWYTPVGDAAALREAIKRAIEHPDEAADMGRRGRAAAAANFGLERYVASLAETILAGSEQAAVRGLQAERAVG